MKENSIWIVSDYWQTMPEMIYRLFSCSLVYVSHFVKRKCLTERMKLDNGCKHCEYWYSPRPFFQWLLRWQHVDRKRQNLFSKPWECRGWHCILRTQQDNCVLQLTPLCLQDSHVKNRKTVLDEQQLYRAGITQGRYGGRKPCVLTLMTAAERADSSAVCGSTVNINILI